jgi:hypothetical protein
MTTAGTEFEVSYEGEGQNSITAVEFSEEKTTPDSPDFGEAPDGGSRAWLVAAGGGLHLLLMSGLLEPIRCFSRILITHQLREESLDKIAWIGSLSAFIQFAAGSIGGPLFDRFGAWACHLAPLTFESVH